MSDLRVDVAPATITIFSDFLCPFAHVVLHRMRASRTQLGLDGAIAFIHRAFPLELLNRAPGSRHGSDSEIPVLGALEPDAGWQVWQGPDYHYPNSVLMAFEAVKSATAQSALAGDQLDAALRRAFWAESRPIHHYFGILNIAEAVPGVDVDRLASDLRAGAYRPHVFADFEIAASGTVPVSPTLFLPDGSRHTNPGIAVHWYGEWSKGFPLIDAYHPEVIAGLVQAAAGR